MSAPENKLKNLLSPDPLHLYTDEELDRIEQIDPVMALRLARAQFLSQQQAQRTVQDAALGGVIDIERVREAINSVRGVLAQDGGDIEFVEVKGDVVRVRMKGACVGCPNAVLDLKNVVERMIRASVPAVRAVVNVF